MRHDHLGEQERGSVMLLTLGYAVLALALILVCVNATSLYLEQKRLDALADAAALAGSDGFRLALDGDSPAAVIEDGLVEQQAAEIVDASSDGAVLVSATAPDERSARVTVAGTWHPPVIGVFVPDGVPLEATATSRTGLR